MKRLFNILLIGFLLLASLLVIMRMQACAHIKSNQREKLTNPNMSSQNQFSNPDSEKEFFSAGENIINGASSIGGGFDCAK